MADPKPTYAHLAQELKRLQPKLAFSHVVVPLHQGGEDVEPSAGESSDFLRAIWTPLPFISAGGYSGNSVQRWPKRKTILSRTEDCTLPTFVQVLIYTVALADELLPA